MIEGTFTDRVKETVENAAVEKLKESETDYKDFDFDKFMKTAEVFSQPEKDEEMDNLGADDSEIKSEDSVSEASEDQLDTSDAEEKNGEPEKIKTINQKFEGHNLDGVPFVRKIVDLGGKLIEGVFPVFESVKDVQLPDSLYKASDTAQVNYCNKVLRNAIEKNPELAKQFTPRQLEAIKNGEHKIPGFTWHHNEELGKMQLVDSEKHANVGHTGGGVLWAGRNEK